MVTVLNATVAACWIIFVAYWTISALKIKPVAERQSVSSSIAYRVPVALGGILLWFPDPAYPLNMVVTPHGPGARDIGDAICVLGLSVAIWSRRILAGNWSSTITFKRDHELIQKGPYRFVRHPIYTGVLTMGLGTAIVDGGLHCWIGLLLVCVGFWIKLNQEELLLLRHFPEEYPSYRARVKALVPFVI